MKFGTRFTIQKKFLIMCIQMFGASIRMRLLEENIILSPLWMITLDRNWVYTISHKNDVLGIFVEWRIRMELQTGRKIKILRSDNRGEYKSDLFLQLCRNECTERHFTVRETSQQNGVTERINRTLLEKIRYLLSNIGMNKSFWVEAVTL